MTTNSGFVCLYRINLYVQKGASKTSKTGEVIFGLVGYFCIINCLTL